MTRDVSPKRRRSKSRERERPDRDRRRRRSRSRERRDERGGGYDRHERDSRRDRHRRSFSRSRSHSPQRDKKTKSNGSQRKQITEADLVGKTESEQEMMKMMGFCGFDTTKNGRVDNNDAGAVHVILKRKYRQYMNRKGGFNRPLDFVA